MLVVFIVFIITFVLNCDAKVQTYLQTCKHFPEKVCIFNLLQQIRLFLPKFIHILSTKSTKCAIYKANFFAFNGISTHERARTYIKTNINAIFVVCLRVCLQRVVVGYSVGYIIAKLPPLQRYNVTPDFHHLRKCMIYLCRVRVSFAVC